MTRARLPSGEDFQDLRRRFLPLADEARKLLARLGDDGVAVEDRSVHREVDDLGSAVLQPEFHRVPLIHGAHSLDQEVQSWPSIKVPAWSRGLAHLAASLFTVALTGAAFLTFILGAR